MQTGWLSPTGEWHPCETYEHTNYASRILNSSESRLENTGWVKITRSAMGIREQKIYWDLRHTLTPEQAHFLRPYFEENDIPVCKLAEYRFRKEME